MFDYPVMTEEEVQKERYKLLDDGEYEAVIDSMIPKISQSGNNMIDVTLSVYDRNGNPKIIFDYIVLTPGMMWKFKHICDSAGLCKEYTDKTFKVEMALRKNVRVRISTKEGGLIPSDKLKGKSEGSRYPTKNVIEDYLGTSGSVTTQAEPSKGQADLKFDDDIPF
jgi:hypothetical protein